MKKTWKTKTTALLSTVLILTGIVGGTVGYPIVAAATNEITPEEELQHEEETQTNVAVDDIQVLEDESDELDERLKKIEKALVSELEANEEQNQQIEELKKQMEELAEENKKIQEELKVAEEATSQFCWLFERPNVNYAHYERRISAAHAYYEMYKDFDASVVTP